MRFHVKVFIDTLPSNNMLLSIGPVRVELCGWVKSVFAQCTSATTPRRWRPTPRGAAALSASTGSADRTVPFRLPPTMSCLKFGFLQRTIRLIGLRPNTVSEHSAQSTAGLPQSIPLRLAPATKSTRTLAAASVKIAYLCSVHMFSGPRRMGDLQYWIEVLGAAAGLKVIAFSFEIAANPAHDMLCDFFVLRVACCGVEWAH